jgi:transposase
MSEMENRDRRRRDGGNGGKVEGGREGDQLSTVSTGHRVLPLGPDDGTESKPGWVQPPDPEVPAKAARRKYSAKYKLKILEQAQACSGTGEVGRLLRREGLYSSHLTAWRKAQREGSLRALEPRKRGRKPVERNPLNKEVQRLERKVARLEEELRKAHVILDVQGKVAGLLGLSFDTEKSS